MPCRCPTACVVDTAAKMVGAMIAKGLVQEVDADIRNGETVWRETGDGHGVTLVATDAGLAAIGIKWDQCSRPAASAGDGLAALP